MTLNASFYPTMSGKPAKNDELAPPGPTWHQLTAKPNSADFDPSERVGGNRGQLGGMMAT